MVVNCLQLSLPLRVVHNNNDDNNNKSSESCPSV